MRAENLNLPGLALLIEGGRWPEGAANAASRREHSALVAEFRTRTAALPSECRIAVIDRTTDMETPEAMMQAIWRMGGKAPALDRWKTETMWMSGYNAPSCRFFAAEKIACVFPGHVGSDFLRESVHSPLAFGRNAPPRTTSARIIIYHEAFGHGTEPEVLFREAEDGWENRRRRYNQELRADIAAVAGICRDEGNTGAARAWAAMRDCASMHTLPIYPAYVYANGPALRRVIAEIEGKGPSFRKLDDAALIGFINDAHARMEVDEAAMESRNDLLRTAYDVLHGKGEKTADAMAYLNDCAQSLCLLCKVDAHQLWKTPAPGKRGPAPKF